MALCFFKLVGRHKVTGEIKTITVTANNMADAMKELFELGYYFVRQKYIWED